MRSRKLIILSLVGLVFCVANFVSYLQMPEYSTIDDGFVYFGWPFSVYFSGGYVGVSSMALTGVIGNVFVALGAARVATALVDRFVTRKKALVRGDLQKQLS